MLYFKVFVLDNVRMREGIKYDFYIELFAVDGE